MPNYHIESIDSCVEKLQGLKGQFPASVDGLRQEFGDGVFGNLASSGDIQSAANAVCTAVHEEFEAAGKRAGQIAEALDKTSVAVQQSEDINAEMMKLQDR